MSDNAQHHVAAPAAAGAEGGRPAPGASEVRPWYREPWPWILMAGPALAVIGCAITIVLAMNHFSDQEIQDGGVKRGLVVSIEKAGPAATPPQVATDARR